MGGTSGGYFEALQVNPVVVVEKIEVWSGDRALQGARLTLSNVYVHRVGALEQHYVGAFNLSYGDGERVESLTIWTSDWGNRVGWLRIRTNKHQEYFAHCHQRHFTKTYDREVDSGIILGAIGSSGADIDSFGILMLRNINGAAMRNVKYPTLEDLSQTAHLSRPKKHVFDSLTYSSVSNSDSDKGFKKYSKSETDGWEWSIAVGMSFTQ